MRIFSIYNKNLEQNYKDIEEMRVEYADTYRKEPKRNQTPWKL